MKALISTFFLTQLAFYLLGSFMLMDLRWIFTQAPEWSALNRSDLVIGWVMMTTIVVGLVYVVTGPQYKKFH